MIFCEIFDTILLATSLFDSCARRGCALHSNQHNFCGWQPSTSQRAIAQQITAAVQHSTTQQLHSATAQHYTNSNSTAQHNSTKHRPQGGLTRDHFNLPAMSTVPTLFSDVSVVPKANVYFDGNVVSHTVLFADGTKKTLGIIRPGTCVTIHLPVLACDLDAAHACGCEHSMHAPSCGPAPAALDSHFSF